MKTSNLIAPLVLVIIIIIVAAAYFSLSAKHGTTSLSTTSLNQGNSNTSTVSNANSTITTTVFPNNVQNRTLTISQVIATLGTGWTAAAQYNGNVNVIVFGTTEMLQGGAANFSKGGTFLVAEYIQFKSGSVAMNYVNTAFNTTFSNATNVTRSKEGNATYIFYSGDSINRGQAASYVYAYDGPYGVLIFNQGSAFPLPQAEQLLSYQISDLNAT